MAGTGKKRFWEIDALRGTAILMMVSFHTIFDLQYFAGWNFEVSTGFWLYFARLTAGIFVFLVGISLAISMQRTEENLKKNPEKKLERNSKNLFWKKYLKRGAGIFSLGLIITLFTGLIFPENTIFFGILHLIGLTIMISPAFYKKNWSGLLLGLGAISTGFILHNLRFSFTWLLWLGVIPTGFSSFDYTPLLPWAGLVLLGLWCGERIYRNGKRSFGFPEYGLVFPFNLLSFLGRHSLLIYFLHQPLIFAGIILFCK